PLERQSLGDVERPLTPQHDPDRRVSGELEARSRRVPGAAELVRETEILAAQQIPRVDGHDLDEDRGARSTGTTLTRIEGPEAARTCSRSVQPTKNSSCTPTHPAASLRRVMCPPRSAPPPRVA